MSTSGDGASSPGAERLRGQIAEDRRALAETVAALHEKTDVKMRVRERAADAEIAAADLAGKAGRTAGSVPRILRWVGTAASDQVRQRVPEPVRTRAGRAAGLVHRPLRLVIGLVPVLLAVLVMRRRLSHRS